MDIEKLIERLGENTDCWTDKVHGYADLRLDAATALSMLQEENEKLRAAQGDTGSTGDSGGTSVAGASLSAAVRRAAIVAEVEKTIKEGDKDKHENE